MCGINLHRLLNNAVAMCAVEHLHGTICGTHWRVHPTGVQVGCNRHARDLTKSRLHRLRSWCHMSSWSPRTRRLYPLLMRYNLHEPTSSLLL